LEDYSEVENLAVDLGVEIEVVEKVL